MSERINDKIEEIEKYLEELGSLELSDFEAYKNDFKIRAICERYLEKIVESVIDLTFLVIKEKKLREPSEEEEIFLILANSRIITKQLALKLKDVKGMRNIIAHEYGKVDDEIVFNAITEELSDDVEEFIKSIKRLK